jgi:hypothetical protein
LFTWLSFLSYSLPSEIISDLINIASEFSIAGNNSLEKADLQPALKALKDRLMTKNVVCILSLILVHFDLFEFLIGSPMKSDIGCIITG